MALQRSLRLEEIQMLGPGDALVRSYGFRYELSPLTSVTFGATPDTPNPFAAAATVPATWVP